MIATVHPGHIYTLPCAPSNLEARWHGHRLHEEKDSSAAPWHANLHGRPVVWYITDSEGIESTVTIRLRFWCDR